MTDAKVVDKNSDVRSESKAISPGESKKDVVDKGASVSKAVRKKE